MKSEIRGWEEVFRFTLIQTLKSKVYRINFAIFIILSLVSLPVVSLILENTKNDDRKISIEKVYVLNETTLQNMDFTKAVKKEAASHIKFITSKEPYDSVIKRIENKERTSVALKIAEDGGVYHLDFISGDKVGENDVQSLSAMIGEYFEKYKIAVLNMTPEQNAIIFAEVTTKITGMDTGGNVAAKKDTSISDNEYWIIYAILFIVLMVILLSSSKIATSVVSEKSSKVIENLLTSIRPLAVIVGKVPAVLLAVLVEVISVIGCILLSALFTSKCLNGDVVGMISAYIPDNIFYNINPVNIICSLVVVSLGLIFYGILGGLCGATASRMEEISECMGLLTIVSLIGFYIGSGAAGSLMSGDNSFATFALLFPLSSPFLLPGAILVGKTNALLLLLAVVLQMVCIVLLFLFVARIYETLILHNGSRIKVKELVRISKNASRRKSLKVSKGGERNE